MKRELMINEVVVLDTTTRYEGDGKVTVTPEGWEQVRQICKHRNTYRADVVLHTDGKVEVTPVTPVAKSSPRYEELYRNEDGMHGCIVRRTKDNEIIRLHVRRNLPLKQAKMEFQQAWLDAVEAWGRNRA